MNFREFMEQPSYTAVMLNEKDHANLVARFPIPNGWTSYAHHMTINMGAASADMKSRLGEKVVLKIVSIAQDARVMAVGVETSVNSVNKNKHITLAVNRSVGAKPFESNKLTNWQPVPPFEIQGWITEVTAAQKPLQFPK